MKKVLLFFCFVAMSLSLFAVPVASTPWVAAFMDLAGLDDIVSIAPATLRHPPEYELKPSDIKAVMDADIFCYAGYEGMMKQLADYIDSEDRADIKITTENSIRVVTEECDRIAEIAGTTPRYESYIETVENGKALVAEKEGDKAKVVCHKMQLPLATDLNLNVVMTIGQGELTANDIAQIVALNPDIIIDNYHNAITEPLKDIVSAPIVIWRNFPATTEPNALEKMVEENIQDLVEVL